MARGGGKPSRVKPQLVAKAGVERQIEDRRREPLHLPSVERGQAVVRNRQPGHLGELLHPRLQGFGTGR